MAYLVLARKSGLMHLAKWLQGELGESSIRVASLRENYQRRAWKGLLRLERLPKGRLDLAAIVGSDTEPRLITDDTVLTEQARTLNIPCWGQLAPAESELPLSPVAQGCWWTGTEAILPHWLFIDWGLWPGGMGPRQVGGLVLAPGTPAMALFDGHREALERARFRGALALELHWDDAAAGWRSGRLRAGWGYHAMALARSAPKAAALLEGSPHTLPAFTAALPVSVPPWPFSLSGTEPVVFTSSPESQRWLVLDDVMANRLAPGGLSTAGFSGALGLAIGTGRELESARGKALAVAASLQLPEPQYRSDFAAWLPAALAALEGRGWW